MGVGKIIKKQGGLKLLKQYWQSGTLFTAIGEFVLLGKDRTALELLRLAAGFKTKKKLIRKYRKKLLAFDQSWEEQVHQSSNKVWICWFQGMENAPAIVQKCHQSVQENMPDKEIILITSENMSSYVEFPDYILEKWKKGQITHTHMTDLLRLELLIRYGGIWVDATVFCTGKVIPDYMINSDLFFFQCLKPGRDGHSRVVSSWFISSKTNNKILIAVQTLCYAYWKENNSMWDYFLLHDFIAIVLEHYPEEWSKVVPRDNAAPHMLLLRLFDTYDETVWEAIQEQTPFHKLTYKFTEEQAMLDGTYYKALFEQRGT